MRRVLMIAFHYPPCFGSSGVLRTLKFSRYLPEHGWLPTVLTAATRAHARTTASQLSDIPEGVEVARTFALDSHRHLAIGGKSLGITSIPDQWASWLLSAIPVGLRLIRKHRPEAIWSTYPIPTAHLIGLALQRLTGLPWIADFRDVMTEDDFPRQPGLRRIYRGIERRVVSRAACLVLTAPSAQRMYLDRYPELSPASCRVIANGYDEEDFGFPVLPRTAAEPVSGRPMRLLHSGLIYEEERDPRPFFRALARLQREGLVTPAGVQVELRAAGSERYFSSLLRDLGLGDLVRLLPPLDYHDALRECAEASGLLLLQGPSCDRQIPAKTYEYLRLGKPILALTTPKGDTAGVLSECGGSTIIDLMDEEALYHALPGFLESLRRGRHPLPDPMKTAQYARHNQARELATCLADVTAPGSRRTP
jgi:glycosyltransferase involved in cell wall biosynthesis